MTCFSSSLAFFKSFDLLRDWKNDLEGSHGKLFLLERMFVRPGCEGCRDRQ